MFSLTRISGLLSRTGSRTPLPRRKVTTALGLESLEGRDLMSGFKTPPLHRGTLPPVPVILPLYTIPPSNSTPPSHVAPPGTTPPIVV